MHQYSVFICIYAWRVTSTHKHLVSGTNAEGTGGGGVLFG